MNISKKIEEIRSEPEHIRLRWVWGSVTVSMLLIIAIWIFSITLMFQDDKKSSQQGAATTTDIAKQLQDLKQQAPSLQDFSDQSLTIEDEGVTKKDTAAVDQIESATSDTDSENQPEIPQASAYSDLSQTLSTQ